MNNLAVGYWSAKLFDDAIRLFEEVLPLRKKKLGPNHPDTVATLANLGVNYRDSGRLPEAIATLEDAVKQIAKLPPLEAAQLRGVFGALTAAYEKAGRHDRAEPAYRQSLAAAVQQFGNDHPNTARRGGGTCRQLAQAEQTRRS